MKVKSYTLLGVEVNPLSISDLNGLISEAVKLGERRIIANHNLHSIYLYYHDPKMRAFYVLADYIHIDSMPLVIWGQKLGFPLQKDHRVTYVDWTNPLMATAAQQSWRVFYLGSKPGVAQKAVEIVQQKFPGLQIIAEHGYFNANFDSQENMAILARIKAYQPNILMVGMGMPRQEHWILDNLDYIQANAILCAGATMDYVAGAVPTPPRWAGKMGLEWLFRLMAEPKRLWRRYLVEPWFLLRLFLIDLFKRNRLKQ